MRARFGLFFAAATALACLLTGCGGAGGGTSASAHRGGFKLTIKWPTTRHIPSLTTRIHLSVDQGGVIVPGADMDVVKPTDGSATSVVTLQDLPTAVPLNFRADAFGKQTETDPEKLVGTVQEPVTLVEGTANVVILDLETTIDHLTATSPDFEGAVLTVAPNQTSQISVAGHPAGDDSTFIPVDTSKLTFGIASGAGFSVSSTGLIRGSEFGSGTVVVTDTDSGKVTNVNVAVVSNVRSLTVGTAGTIGIFNHQSLNLLTVVKAFDKNNNPIANPNITFAVTGTGLTLQPDGHTVLADEGVVSGNGTIATGTVTVTVPGSALTGNGNITVAAHDIVKTMSIIGFEGETEIHFRPVTLGDVTIEIGPPTNFDQFGLQAKDKYGNDVPLTPTELSWSLTTGDAAEFSLDGNPPIVKVNDTSETLSAETLLRVRHIPTNVATTIRCFWPGG